MAKTKFGKALSYPFKHNKGFVITTLVAIPLVLAVNLVITQVPLISNTFNTVFGEGKRHLISGDVSTSQYYKTDEGIKTKEDSLANGNRVNEEICEEGMVLLKNEDEALPLAKKAKVSVFGMNSVNLVYGGSGSAAKKGSNTVDLYQSLTDAGLEVNPKLKDFYEKKTSSGKGRPASPSMGDILTGFATGELPLSEYSDSISSLSSGYSDAALMVVSRIGGEAYDLPTQSLNTEGRSDPTEHYLELDDNEKALLQALCAEDSPFSKVILVINSGTTIELGFLQDEATYHNKLKAAIYMGLPGEVGAGAFGKILTGEVNPSGRTVDTYAKDFTKIPSYENFGTNGGKGNSYFLSGTEQNAHFVDYEEGIYVGYRYFETRGAQEGESWYQENVVYPFGYGLSYSDFSWTLENTPTLSNAKIEKGKTYEVKVKVTNNGTLAGKDVVELYGHAPYTSGGIEKADRVLVGFSKTKLLQPNESETLTLTFDPYTLASYDYKGVTTEGGYVLEKGDYSLSISKDSHHSLYTVPFEVTSDIYYNEASDSETKVENRFADVSEHLEGSNFSRSDFSGTYPTTPTEEDKNVDEDFIYSLTMEAYIGEGDNLDVGKPWYSERKPRQKRKQQTAEQCTTKLYMLIGKDYDDPLWDKLLNQLTYSEMRYLIGTGNFNTAALDNIDKPKTIDPDGPAGFTNFMSLVDSTASVYETTYYASECLIAGTWNRDLVEEMGVAIGNESLIGNARGGGQTYSGWYAPAVNIHRNPFAGRNWEYYSEDPLLSGKMAASVIQGAKSKGVYTCVKHFAVNDQETNRDTNGLITWVNEQALREIYLKPFEYAVKEGKTAAMMSSFNRIGTVWAGGSYELLTDVLRKEWGFKGMVITDYNTNDYMKADQMIRAGGDLNLIQDKQPSEKGTIVTPSHQMAIRRATKNILYTVANSNAMNGIGEGIVYGYSLPMWMTAMIIADVVIFVLLVLFGFFSIRHSLKKEKKEAK